ncbi:hypothetical protein DNU06_14255 [Putridiphycobacter roseus]|uniref:UspA domain-containing protein n=1 Tax=Putridiphycobacter roseus TaxID=2219161 RepID=A0A2W1NDH4_9FLAO|nr:universal stress protein [Putridiphycobacter roseus]PZE16126.1 hypothetical protein DNU06_14255 [Putridiphycobacter roseus]
MKNILFPTNFTEHSNNAFIYALEYAKKTGSKLVVYHTFDPNAPISEETIAFYGENDLKNFIYKKEKFLPFENLKEAHHAKDVKVKYIVEEGEFIANVKAYIEKKEDKISLVIMGAQRNSNQLFNFFMETKTLQLVSKINKPVIAVPKPLSFDGAIDNIAFLVDYREDEKGPLLEILAQTKTFNATLHVIHVDLAHSESIVPQMDQFKDSLAYANIDKVTFKSIDSINLRDSLSVYCKENNIDMVCLINHYRNFYQRLFSYSLAEMLIDHLDIPVMAIYQD